MMSADTITPGRLDHVAIHVRDRDAFTRELTSRLDVHVIEQTDRFTLVGAHADYGKLTLLDAVDDRDPTPNRIVSLVLAEASGSAGSPPEVMPGGLVLTFAKVDDLGADWAHTPHHALVAVAVRAEDPPAAAAQLEAGHDVRVGAVGHDHAVLEVGEENGNGRITLTRETWSDDDRPSMLDHVGIRVADAQAWRDHFERTDAVIDRWVEAAHSKAVFVEGPEGLLVEYVELTAPLEG